MKFDREVIAEIERLNRATPDEPKKRRQLPDPFDRFTAHSFGGGNRSTGERRHVDEAILAQVVAAGVASGTARFRVINPTPRVRLKLLVSHFTDLPGDTVPNLTACTLTLVPWVPDLAGNEAPADAIVTAEPLPYGYEGETSADTIRGTLTLGTPTSLIGYLKAVAAWDPPEDMSDERWEAVRGRCSITRVGSIVQLTAGATP